MGIKVKSIAFNLDDPDQSKMLEHVEQRTNFSFYMKSLILRDIQDVSQPKPMQQEESKEMDVSSLI